MKRTPLRRKTPLKAVEMPRELHEALRRPRKGKSANNARP